MTFPQVSRDILEFIGLLNKHEVRYVLVGGVAVIYYGYPRYTGDVDIFYDSAAENTQKLFLALQEFWGGSIPVISGVSDLQTPGMVIQFGTPPHRLDLINRIDGVSFRDVYKSALAEVITPDKDSHSLEIRLIDRKLLIKNKKSSGRLKDLDDVKNLEKKSGTQ